MKQCWCIPPEANAEFVCCMEEVLAVYQRPFDPKRPLLCMDEISKQLLADSRPPLPLQAGKPERYDYEYVRHGTANVFLFFAPLLGQRHLKVTDQRTRKGERIVQMHGLRSAFSSTLRCSAQSRLS